MNTIKWKQYFSKEFDAMEKFSHKRDILKADFDEYSDQLCREYLKNILDAVELAAKNDELGTLESIMIAIGQAKRPVGIKTLDKIWLSSPFTMTCICDVRDKLNLDNDNLELVLDFCTAHAISPYMLIDAVKSNHLDIYGLPDDLLKLLKHESI